MLNKMEPIIGFEPTTCTLRGCCSTPELNWLSLKNINNCLLPNISALKGSRLKVQGFKEGQGLYEL